MKLTQAWLFSEFSLGQTKNQPIHCWFLRILKKPLFCVQKNDQLLLSSHSCVRSYVKYTQAPDHSSKKVPFGLSIFHVEARYMSELLTDQFHPKELANNRSGKGVSMYRKIWIDWERRWDGGGIEGGRWRRRQRGRRRPCILLLDRSIPKSTRN
jgi:hypothetical protein